MLVKSESSLNFMAVVEREGQELRCTVWPRLLLFLLVIHLKLYSFLVQIDVFCEESQVLGALRGEIDGSSRGP